MLNQNKCCCYLASQNHQLRSIPYNTWMTKEKYVYAIIDYGLCSFWHAKLWKNQTKNKSTYSRWFQWLTLTSPDRAKTLYHNHSSVTWNARIQQKNFLFSLDSKKWKWTWHRVLRWLCLRVALIAVESQSQALQGSCCLPSACRSMLWRTNILNSIRRNTFDPTGNSVDCPRPVF